LRQHFRKVDILPASNTKEKKLTLTNDSPAIDELILAMFKDEAQTQLADDLIEAIVNVLSQPNGAEKARKILKQAKS
jgi:hypothetical protein